MLKEHDWETGHPIFVDLMLVINKHAKIGGYTRADFTDALIRVLMSVSCAGRCGAPGCGRFIIEFGSRGRPRRHCSENHRRKADVIASQKRSQERRLRLQREKAEKLFRNGESVDYVRGACPKLTEEKIKQIAKTP